MPYPLTSRMISAARPPLPSAGCNGPDLSYQHDHLVTSLLIAAAHHLAPGEWEKTAVEAVALADRIYPKEVAE